MEFPYLKIKIKNSSKKNFYRNFHIDIIDDSHLFENTRLMIDQIKPNESITAIFEEPSYVD